MMVGQLFSSENASESCGDGLLVTPYYAEADENKTEAEKPKEIVNV